MFIKILKLIQLLILEVLLRELLESAVKSGQSQTSHSNHIFVIRNCETTGHTHLMTSDVIILKLLESFNICKYFNIFFGVIYGTKKEAGNIEASIRQILTVIILLLVN